MAYVSVLSESDREGVVLRTLMNLLIDLLTVYYTPMPHKSTDIMKILAIVTVTKNCTLIIFFLFPTSPDVNSALP